MYLYRAVDGKGTTVEFCLSRTRGIAAAKAFFRKALKHHREPHSITLDGHRPSHSALRRMGRKGEFNFQGRNPVKIRCCQQCATRHYRHRTGAEDSQTPVRLSDPMAVESRGDLASRHGSIVRIAAAHSWSYRSDNPICTRTVTSDFQVVARRRLARAIADLNSRERQGTPPVVRSPDFASSRFPAWSHPKGFPFPSCHRAQVEVVDVLEGEGGDGVGQGILPVAGVDYPQAFQSQVFNDDVHGFVVRGASVHLNSKPQRRPRRSNIKSNSAPRRVL